MTYNLIIFENKYPSEYLNISTERELFEKLWDWTYIDDLWYFIEEENPNKEYLNDFIENTFIDDNIFHKYEDDDTNCYVFEVNNLGRTRTYLWDHSLIDFIYEKISEKYERI